MEEKNQDFSQAMRLAQTQAGQQLLSVLQKSYANELQQAMTQASQGNLDQVKKTMAQVLASPEIKAMLEGLRGQMNG